MTPPGLGEPGRRPLLPSWATSSRPATSGSAARPGSRRLAASSSVSRARSAVPGGSADTAAPNAPARPGWCGPA
ncbi:MAG: hypothetical protein ACR2FU_16905, partial [Streptosporangiaceae bacterium]